MGPVTCGCDVTEQPENFDGTLRSMGEKQGDGSWAPKPETTDVKLTAPPCQEDDSKTALSNRAQRAEQSLLCPSKSLGKQVPQ